MTDFSVPFVQEDLPLVGSKQASEEAFYAAASSSENPLQDYLLIKNDLEQTGKSDYVEAAKSRWEQETDAATRDAIIGYVNDPTISPAMKTAMMQNYAATSAVPASLKDKYITKLAARDLSVVPDDIHAQDLVANTLSERRKRNVLEVNKENVYKGSVSFMDVVKGIAGVSSSVLLSIPAGYAGMYQVAKENGKASEVIASIQQAGYMPEGEGAKHVMETIMKVAQTLGIPAEWLGQKTLDLTGSPAAATGVEVLLDPLNFIPIGKAVSIAKQTVKGTPKIPASSPLEATNVANPQAAGQAAMGALNDGTGQFAAALGVDNGSIVHDWVLPKVMGDVDAKAHPDLVEAILAQDKSVREAFQELRYDPNLINVTKREAEVAATFQIIKEARTPYYNQSMSIINETDELFEGSAVFGRNSSSGYVKESDAQKAYTTLKASIDNLPKEHQGDLSIVKYDGQHYINWQWKREYDDLSNKIFGSNSIQTSFLGIDVSGVARSRVGRWLFPTGRFPKWTEEAGLRGIERTAYLRNELTAPIRERIAKHKHGVELDYLIREAEETGTDYFSPAKIAAMFPKLNKKAVDELFTTHTFWVRQQQYNHNFLNREVRHDLVKKGMQGVYDKAGNYLGAATSKVGPSEIEKIREIFDLETQQVIKYSADELAKQGKTLVRLNEKVKSAGAIHQYAAVGGKVQLNLLPQEVLARIPGYSGRKVSESWYVTVIPKTLKVNGLTETDMKYGLRDYAETKAAARNEAEATKIQEMLQAKHPEHLVEVRPERQENFGRVLTDYSIHQEMSSHSMKRGERLPSLNGPARIEDRMVTLINTTNSLARMGALRAWDDSFQSSFVKGFGEYTGGKFPQYATDIVPKENMSRELAKEYKNAQALFKWYERIKNSETVGDFIWTKGMNGLADILEKWKIPADLLRGKKQNPLMLAKTIATTAYIHLAPIRQHLIQPIQQLEMYALNPKTAGKNFTNTAAIRMYLSSESNLMKNSGGAEVIKKIAQEMGTKAGEKEFLETVDAIRKSGMLQSVDMNSIVHGVFKEVDRNLVENIPTKIWKDIEATAKAPVRFARTVGFDAAELTNRVGNWLQVRDIWRNQNPGKSWKTKESIESISAEALKLSGAMNKAGQLPYQEGALSIFFQFAAINHKMTMNLLQDNATLLSGSQRARLAAVRFALFGGKYGIPGGAIAYHFINQSENEEVKAIAEDIKRGAIDYAANGLLAAMVEPDVPIDIAIAKVTTPYSEGFMPYFQVGWETMKLFDDKPSGPRYPAFGMISSFGQAIEDMQGWWHTREVNEQSFPQMAMEAAEVASGFNSYMQGLLMLGMRDKITKMGNKHGLEFTAAEAYAKMTFGLGTQKEEDLWALVELTQDTKKQKKEMARMFYRQLENQRVKGNEENYEMRVRKLNSFISLLDPKHFSEADKLDVIEEMEKLDKYNYTTIKQSILVDHWKYHQEEMTQKRMQTNDILERIQDEDVQRYMKAIKEGKQ